MGSGRGHIKLLVEGERSLMLIDGATTQTRTLKKYVSSFMKKNAASIRPSFSPFEVRIWTSVMAEKKGHHDVDNVAKAVLDSLTGYIWRDDRQVVRLISERFTGPQNRIAVRVAPIESPLAEIPLDESLFQR